MTVIRDSSTIAVTDGTATVHGWVQDVRNLGGISFLTLRDRHGTLQVTMPKKKIEPELFEKLTKLPRESVVSITGDVKESNQTALGLELIPTSAEVIGEAAVPLPMGSSTRSTSRWTRVSTTGSWTSASPRSRPSSS